MVLLIEFKNRIRDLIDADKQKGQLGTGTTAPTEDDTGLETADATTLIDLTSTKTDRQLVLNYTLPSPTGNGNTYTEYEVRFNSGNTNGNRIVFTGLAKIASEEWQVSIILQIR